MKKTSLFILLILLTFSLSQSNFKIHFQSKQAYIGIREGNKIEDFINKKMKLPNEKKKIIKSGVEGIGFQDMFVSSSFSPRITAKLREIQINGLYFFLEELKLNNKYWVYIISIYNVIVEGPPKYERKCKSGFLGIGKKCKNVEVAQTFTQNEINEILKEINNKMIADAFVDLPNLPKEDYEQYKQILRFKFPQNKNLK